MDAQEYNRLREQAYIQQRITDEQILREQLRELYQESMRAIEADMNRWLGRFATDRGISMKEARKSVDKTDVEALADKAKKYVEEKNFSPQANEELQRYNLKMRMSRYELLRNEINLELIALGDAEAKLMRDYFNATYLEEVQRQAGILGISSKSQEVLRHNMAKVIDSSYKSATWSDRLWANNDSLRARLGVGLRATMLQGENPRAWAKRLRQELRKESLPEKGKDNAIFRSERLAITEASRVQIAAQLDCYDKAGYNALEVVTEPGACSECIAHDGAIVPLSEAQQGVNIPSFHPFCRCSTAVSSLDEDTRQEINEQAKRQKGHPDSDPVNWDMLLSPEYRAKFKGITGDPIIDDILWKKSIQMHRHLEGTLREDMYLISLGQRKIVGAQTHSYVNYRVEYNKSLTNASRKYSDLLSLHSHPVNSPPSGGDFASNARHGYVKGVVALPNGDVWEYGTRAAYSPAMKYSIDAAIERFRNQSTPEDISFMKGYALKKEAYRLKWKKR